ncbi:MAG: hypothetical protein J0I17_08490 ['Candidatus Kapabacteria' thiocyanatum]|uniref:Uncharacterized protein n=1 Tax=Candidatus Kapaibacterium thiocyanatum TaxID=1895771 RepID=A0A1M3KZD7_9BACT|nr:hypothetical protein ['Candidatus Kapabacteria' thiocyanatum]OJX57851.1 MAG: hypothetical protein BGO89_07735 ['Candidatus Kapabacteria' thiocyanatum]
MQLIISKTQYEYLLDHFSKENMAIWQLIEFQFEDKRVLLTIDEDQADDIQDWASERLLVVGFDMDYKLNPEGRILEEIMDIFFV